jgi:hypothetical protein
MTAVKAWVGNAENDASSADGIPASLRQTLIHSICLNSTGTVAPGKVWLHVYVLISVLHVGKVLYCLRFYTGIC